MTNEQQQRLEVLLEGMNKKCDLLLDGQAALIRKVDCQLADIIRWRDEFADVVSSLNGVPGRHPD